MADKYRLITRSDFDGLMSAVLLKELGMVDKVEFVHPKDMQDGKVPVTAGDITANLPYVEGVHLAFDHHASELTRVGERKNFITEPDAPSAARVIWKHYGGADKFPNISEALMAAVDKSDSAQFTRDEILNPEGWVLLSFIMDARTGLGRFHDFAISNKDLMFKMIDLIGKSTLDEILGDEDVVERVELYKRHAAINAEQIERCGRMHKNLLVLDRPCVEPGACRPRLPPCEEDYIRRQTDRHEDQHGDGHISSPRQGAAQHSPWEPPEQHGANRRSQCPTCA